MELLFGGKGLDCSAGREGKRERGKGGKREGGKERKREGRREGGREEMLEQCQEGPWFTKQTNHCGS